MKLEGRKVPEMQTISLAGSETSSKKECVRLVDLLQTKSRRFNVELQKRKIDARTITVNCSLEINVEGAPGNLSLFTT